MLLRARMIESKSNISSTYTLYIIYLTIVICKGIYLQGIFINIYWFIGFRMRSCTFTTMLSKRFYRFFVQIEWAVVKLLTGWILLEKRTWMYGSTVFCSFRKFQDLSKFPGCLNFFLYVRLRSFV